MALYVPIRDDSGLKSLSNVERDFIRSCAFHKSSTRTVTSSRIAASSALRVDGREWNQLRPQRLHLVRWNHQQQLQAQDIQNSSRRSRSSSRRSGATATVQWGGGAARGGGNTRVTCTCTAELIPPLADRPSEGQVRIAVDLSPSASTSFRQTPAVATMMSPTGGGTGSTATTSGGGGNGPADAEQKLLSNRILRCLERIVLTGGTLDTEALCVTPGKWVWRLNLAVTVLDAGGNLVDACTLACMAALRHYRKPHVDLEDTNAVSSPKLISTDIKEPTPLPLHHTPLSISFALIPNNQDSSTAASYSSSSNTPVLAALVDPNAREELVLTGRLTIAMNVHGEICFLDYGGGYGCELSLEHLRDCQALARTCIEPLCQSLETSLQEADEQAKTERLHRLQQHQQVGESDRFLTLPPPPDRANDMNVAYFQALGNEEYQEETDNPLHISTDAASVAAAAMAAQEQAEEAYRQQALDYNLGHVASKIREDRDNTPKPQNNAQRGNLGTSSSLLATLLQSVQTTATPSQAMEGADARLVAENLQSLRKQPQNASVTNDVSDRITAMELEDDQDASNNDKLLSSVTPSQPASDPSADKSPRIEEQAASYQLGSDDEEEETMQLTSEFASAAVESSKAPTPLTNFDGTPMVQDDEMADAEKDDDVDDLTAAIKKKKKKSKKKN